MPLQVDCSSSLVCFFPPTIYQSVGSSTVLPELLQSLNQDSISTIQFLRNGAVRITFKSSADCDRVVSSGIRFRDVPLRVVSVDAKSRLVYLRDCPSEVPDDVVKRFFSSFGEVHSISRSCHQAFPGIFDGNRVIKITLTKDVPGIVSVASFECRVWYRRQPAFCAICKKLGHRSKSCPLNGLCRRCRRPGHHARDCSSAWVPVNPPGPPLVQATVSEVRPPCPASAEADVSDANPSEQDAEMSDEDYVPPSGSEPDPSISSMDEALASGDDEVVAATLSLSPSGSPRHRRKRRRRLSSLTEMDVSVEELPGHRQFKTFRAVWEDRVSWEEVRARKPQYRPNVIPAEPSPSPTPSPSQSFSASSSTPVPPVSPVPSSFSSNGSVVDSVPTPTPERPRVRNRPQPRR